MDILLKDKQFKRLRELFFVQGTFGLTLFEYLDMIVGTDGGNREEALLLVKLLIKFNAPLIGYVYDDFEWDSYEDKIDVKLTALKLHESDPVRIYILSLTI
jgi:hypothetical protein